MGASYEDIVHDFDLSFLRQSPRKQVKNQQIRDTTPHKIRKQLLILKKKTIHTSSLINTYYANQDHIQKQERLITTTKDDCRQLAIDLNEASQKITQLEKENESLQNSTKQLEESLSNCERRHAALESHCNQLQLLVKERDKSISSVRSDCNLEKCSVKELKKKLNQISKERDTQLKHLAIFAAVLFGKKKLSKKNETAFKAYIKSSVLEGCEDDFSDEEDEELISHNNVEASSSRDLTFEDIPKDNVNADSTSELRSIDTGRGSSVASSPVEYYSDTPFSPSDSLCGKVDVGTSPIVFQNISVATQTNFKINNLNDQTAILHKNVAVATQMELAPEIQCQMDRATSPILRIINAETGPHYLSDCAPENDYRNGIHVEQNTFNDFQAATDKAPIPENNIRNEIESLPEDDTPNDFDEIQNDTQDETDSLPDADMQNEIDSDSDDTQIVINIISEDNQIVDSLTTKNTRNKVAIETDSIKNDSVSKDYKTNNTAIKTASNNNPVSEDDTRNDTDWELQQIFNKMRLDHNLISPIPSPLLSLTDLETRTRPTVFEQLERKVLNQSQSILSLEQKYKNIENFLISKGFNENDINESSSIINKINAMDSSNALKIIPMDNVQSTMHSDNDEEEDISNKQHYGDRTGESLEELNDQNDSQAEEIENEIHTIGDDNGDNDNDDDDAATVILCPLSDEYMGDVQKVSADKDSEDCKRRKKTGLKKLSRLEKLRTNMMSKGKIKKFVDAPRKLRNRTKRQLMLKRSPLSKTKEQDAYAKAVLIWKQLESTKKALKSTKLHDTTKSNKDQPANIDEPVEKSVKDKRLMSSKSKSESNNTTCQASENDHANGKDTNSITNAKTANKLFDSAVDCHRHCNLLDSKKALQVVLDKSRKKVTDVKTSQKQNVTESNSSKDDSTTPNKRILRSSSRDSPEVIAKRDKGPRKSPRQRKTLDVEDDHKRKLRSANCLSSENLDANASENKRILRSSRRFGSASPTEDVGTKTAFRRFKRIRNPSPSEASDISDVNSREYATINESTLCPSVSTENNEFSLNSNCGANIGTKDEKIMPRNRKVQKRKSIDLDNSDVEQVEQKRKLRSSRLSSDETIPENKPSSSVTCNENTENIRETKRTLRSNKHLKQVQSGNSNDAVSGKGNIATPVDKVSISYDDLEIFNDEPGTHTVEKINKEETVADKFRNSVLCKAIEKYAVNHNRFKELKLPEAAVNSISKKIEESIAHIATLPVKDRTHAMNKLTEEIRNMNGKHFVAGLIKYLSEPERKFELFNKDNVHPAPSMTKSEQVLLYILINLKQNWPTIYDSVLSSIEYYLFRLNRTPPFEVIESMSHTYAVICRYIDDKSRLRFFLISAMYCIQFKSYSVIKQCLDVWMHILPLAHMGMAKSPLVTCCIYLLHFYRCEDKFKRVEEIRNILARNYNYKTSEWSETKILEMFKSAIFDLNDSRTEKQMLRFALILLAKRHGPRWCQTNLIQNMLKPIIDRKSTPEKVKIFCVSVLGPLLKPYPVEMKVHCEIVMNELVDMLKHNPSPGMQESIITSLIFMSKHNQTRVVSTLAFWQGPCGDSTISQDLKDVLKDFIKERPIKVWKTILANLPQE